jgi:hypothetical protein
LPFANLCFLCLLIQRAQSATSNLLEKHLKKCKISADALDEEIKSKQAKVVGISQPSGRFLLTLSFFV